jgi:hypothetical protein
MALTRPRAHQLSGVSAKSAVRVLSNSNVTLSGGTPATVDGVSLTIDDRILVTGQTTASENGLYRCTVAGSGSNGTWVRSRDGSHQGTIVAGMTCMITEGSTYADTLWKLTTDGAITIGTTALTFEQHTEVIYGPPGGSDTHVQFNDGGAYGGDAGLVYNKTTDALTISGDILNGQSDGVGNIGSSSVGFNTVHAKATSAQYADLAEIYKIDVECAPSTVVVFGGAEEITQSTISHDRKVAGVISTQPAHLMNSTAKGQPVALQGRVPCKVIGPIKQGELVVTSNIPGTAQRLDDNLYMPGQVIGKALETIEDDSVQTIEVVVGRL